MIWRAARRRARVDAAVAAYRHWHSERDAVRGVSSLVAASAFAEPLAFEAYQSALDREGRAAKTYARPMRRVRHLTETGLAHQLALIQAPPGRARAMTTVALHAPQRLATGGASSPCTAFVLSGGAGLGALQVGMLEALTSGASRPIFWSAPCRRAQRCIRRIATPVPPDSEGARPSVAQPAREDVFPVSMSALVAAFVVDGITSCRIASYGG